MKGKVTRRDRLCVEAFRELLRIAPDMDSNYTQASIANCRFAHRLYHGCIVMLDLNFFKGSSITNCAESIVPVMLEEYGSLPIVYWDSTGKVDQVLHKKGKFHDFELLPENISIERACRLALAIQREFNESTEEVKPNEQTD